VSPEKTLSELGERALIALIDSVVGEPGVTLGIGDDTAALPTPGEGDLLATTDSLVQDVHFNLAEGSGRRVGEKALAVNLSDIAAMGGTPRWALVSLIAPPETPVAFVRELYLGLVSMARRFGVAIVGGNVSASPATLAVDVTLLGSAPSGQLVTRSGARLGDIIVVTGTLGRAAAERVLAVQGHEPGGTVSVPEPRISVGRSLAAAGLAHAMIDISDGLATDIHHLVEASSAGAVIYAADVPIDIAARKVGRQTSQNPLNFALFGGEDYELLFTMSEAQLPRAIEAAGDIPLAVIGTIVAPEYGVVLQDSGGVRTPLEAGGWEHFRRG